MAKRDKLAQCDHRGRVNLGTHLRCAVCKQLLSLGEANEPEVDIAAGRIAAQGGLADGENLYELPLGSHRISTGDQGDAWAWDISRPLAEQLAETARDAMREVRACLHLANSDTPDADLMPDPCPKCGLYYMGDNSVEESRGRGFVGIDRSLAPTLVQYPLPRPLLGAETCTHDHMTEAETALSFGVDGELG